MTHLAWCLCVLLAALIAAKIGRLGQWEFEHYRPQAHPSDGVPLARKHHDNASYPEASAGSWSVLRQTHPSGGGDLAQFQLCLVAANTADDFVNAAGEARTRCSAVMSRRRTRLSSVSWCVA